MATAQSKKKKEKKKDEKVPVYNYVIDDPMDAFGRNPEPLPVGSLLFPEFYSYVPTTYNDTTYTYLCYDRRDSLINVDSLHDINLVRYISLFKSYADRTNFYTDAQGKKQPLPVSKIIRRYDKLGTDKWMTIDYATNKYTELREYPAEIVRTEIVTVTHPLNKIQTSRTHNYYKVTPKQ